MSYTASITKIFHTWINQVWNWLTDPTIVREYFFGTELVSDWQVGSQIQFKWSWEWKPYVDGWIILSIESPNHLSYNYHSSWSPLPDTPENRQTITYNLREIGDTTELIITQTNCSDPSQVEHSEKNWDMVLEGMRKIIEK
jgi:uncharacterized protein YndB with AHSA1/START domain